MGTTMVAQGRPSPWLGLPSIPPPRREVSRAECLTEISTSWGSFGPLALRPQSGEKVANVRFQGDQGFPYQLRTMMFTVLLPLWLLWFSSRPFVH